MVYALGPVKPHVKAAADIIGPAFGVSTIYGVASRNYTSDHPLGLALDFMVGGDKAKGDAIAAHVVKNASKYQITYVIWYQKIWSTGRASEGWRAMENRGSATANHLDHVHVSFSSLATGTPTAQSVDFDLPGPGDFINPWGFPTPGIPGQDEFDALKAFFSWLSDGHNWVRIGYVVGGVILILLALAKFGAVQSGIIGKVKP